MRGFLHSAGQPLDEIPTGQIQIMLRFLHLYMDIDVEPEVHWARRYAAEIGVGFLILGGILIVLAIWSTLRTSQATQHPVISLWTGSVDVSKSWQNTGISVKHDTTLVLNAYAMGCVRWASDVRDSRGVCVGPDGAPWTPIDLKRPDDFPLPNANCGALLMRVGDHIYSIPSATMIKVDEDGEVQFAANIRQAYLSAASGKFHVQVKEWK